MGPDSVPAALVAGLADLPTVNAAIGVLAVYGMIGVDPVGGAISVHRLVQAVTRGSGRAVRDEREFATRW
ncbi:hypothetical protein [Nocardia sp. BMG111209]|uniref:hypothetical protein n=1 Tax=Nocardia sp. BMG111209 TaxID=1160137 RepID=UPI0018CAFBE6|nr:hypothetical protein [Nocardia sp. BMG111209]